MSVQDEANLDQPNIMTFNIFSLSDCNLINQTHNHVSNNAAFLLHNFVSLTFCCNGRLQIRRSCPGSTARTIFVVVQKES